MTLILKKGFFIFSNKNLSSKFDDGSSDPFSSYCSEDFDFNDAKKFKFKSKGTISLAKNNENRLYMKLLVKILKSRSLDLEKSLKKILIKHKYMSLN